MDTLSLLLIALGLSMDAFAVSVTTGGIITCNHMRNALRMAFYFGLFQAVMPLAGWFGAGQLRAYIVTIDHWIAFALLVFIGGKMIVGAVRGSDDKMICEPLTTGILFMLAVATSIDALAVGISFACLNIAIVTPVIVIGLVTFMVSLLGFRIGVRMGHFFENRIEIAGGIILIMIGVRILVEHMT